MAEEGKGPRTTGDETWNPVENAANEAEAAMIVGFLQNHDIPARVIDKSFHLTPTTGEDLSPIEIWVPTARLEEAERVLKGREAAFKGTPEGGETVLTDEGMADIDTAGNDGGGEKPVR